MATIHDASLGLIDMSDPFLARFERTRQRLHEKLNKYRIIYVGYIVALATFAGTIYTELFDLPPALLFLNDYHLEQIVFATMVFSVFMLIYFVREQERLKCEMTLEEQKKIREGIWIAEQEIRNQIILINQATHIAEKKKELGAQMIKIIRDNTKKMEKHLELLQQDDVDPRTLRARFYDA